MLTLVKNVDMWVNSQKLDVDVSGPVHAYIGFSLLDGGVWIPLG
jgi:hypothetical protein